MAAVTQTYRNKGYFLALATVPPQQVTNGEVQVTVSEGRIGESRRRGQQKIFYGLHPEAFRSSHPGEKVASRETLEHLIS